MTNTITLNYHANKTAFSYAYKLK